MQGPLVLFEDEGFVNLLPLVFWRCLFELRLGRKIILDRSAQHLGLSVAGVWTRDWIARVAGQRCGAPVNQAVGASTVLVNGRWIFDGPVKFPKAPHVGMIDSEVAYVLCDAALAKQLCSEDMLHAERRLEALDGVAKEAAPGRMLHHPWEVIADLAKLLKSDWQAADAVIETALDPELRIDNREQIHVGERTRIHPTVLISTEEGPVFISHDVQIGAYTVIEGPAYIGPGTMIRPHTWLHGANAIGPVCKIGGELDGCILHGYSNKQHAGFLGHAYVGSWVNLGAGATNSDLKNTYGAIRVPINGYPVGTGLQFFGAIIGDHAKIGINATIPTGGVIGMASSISSSGMLPRYLPSFSWVTQDRTGPGDPLRLLDSACAAMARRGVEITDDEVELLLDLGTRVKMYEKQR